LQHATEVFEWIENGAHVYICGAKEPMSIDVENTLIQIIKEQRNHSEEGAIQYMEHLKGEGRFVKDVY